MAQIGLLVTLLGFILSVVSLGVTSSVGVRMVMTLAGIIVSLGGIFGMINPDFQKSANWRK